MECLLSNQTTWESGVIVREAMRELIGRFPNKPEENKKTKNSQCLKWRDGNQANQLEICSKKNETGEVGCVSLHEMIYKGL